jgi:hypothetical protein
VNSYGAEFGDRAAFSKLLQACGFIEGLERVRFTSPHPKDFTDDVIEAMATTPNVMHSLHMPLQSGSDDVLKRMRRSYRQEKYLGIIDRVRAAMPDAAITTDIIVGFPGETETDFEQTLDVVRAARFANAFTFQYSKRLGTPAAEMADQVPASVVRERYGRLVALADELAWSENLGQVARTARRTGSAAAPPTTGWCTWPQLPRSLRPGPATWSRPRSPTRRRTTWWPTSCTDSAAPGPATPGKRDTVSCQFLAFCSGCRASASRLADPS